MAGVAEKARFYLERSVPQLREWEEREIFSKDEIRTIVQKRNQFEHKVLAPGNTAYDWSSYARWEETLEKLRAKRCQRLAVRHLATSAAPRAGQARVLGIYDRGVARHPGSGPLWREYLAYTAGIQASKRWRRTMTKALRMMPTDPDLWVMAGRRSAATGDMAAARGFFMRGCRFCTADGRLWLEYARCEMDWLVRMEKTRGKSKTTEAIKPARQPNDDGDNDDDDDELRLESDSEIEDEDGVILPEPPTTITTKKIDAAITQNLVVAVSDSNNNNNNSPALDGAIPIAIFDVARKQPFFRPDLAERFFLMLADYRHLSVGPRVAQHVLDALDAHWPHHPATANCLVRQPVAGISPLTADFPRGLRQVLPRLAEKLAATSDRPALVARTRAWIDECLAVEGLDEAIRTVLEHTKESLVVEP